MKSLKGISNQELINQLKKLVKQEQDLTLNILPHLIEFERRELYRDLGYRSLYEYCTRELKYSESAAMRRIHAARAINKCPSAIDYLRSNRVNLSTLSIAWKYVTPELLNRISNKSKKEVDTIVAEFNPELYIKDRSKPVVVERLVSHPGAADQQDTNTSCKEIYRRSGGKLFARVEKSTPIVEPEIVRQKVKMHEVRCFIDDDVMHQLERCKELLSGKYPMGLNYSELLKELAAEWLERHDPVIKSERRDARKQRSTKTPRPKDKQTRHIPVAIRDAIFKRDGGRCAFVGSNGKRCNSKWDLEIHHDSTPFGRGGVHSVKNLKLLCSAHNKLEAEKEYGKAIIKEHYIKEAKGAYLISDRGRSSSACVFLVPAYYRRSWFSIYSLISRPAGLLGSAAIMRSAMGSALLKNPRFI